MSYTPPASASPGAATPSDPSAVMQQLARQQQQQQQQLQQLAARQQQMSSPAPAFDVNALAALLQQQQAAMQQQQLQATAQLLTLQALGGVPPFTGNGAVTGLEVESWLQQVERHFTAREAALGISAQQADSMRVTLAANAFPPKSVAQDWYGALPAGALPTTWAAFRDALLGRFNSTPNVRARLEQLRTFVEAGRRLRDKMTLQGLQSFTARFQQLAGGIPDSHLTAHGKLELLARGLSTRLAEVVLIEDAKDPPLALHEVIKRVLAKASFKEYAAGYNGTASSPPAGDSMEIDAISLCATQFGITREEASHYLAPQEGWSVHETHGGESQSAAAASSAPAASPKARSTASSEDVSVERLLAAFATHLGQARGSSSANKGQSKRRNAPGDVAKEVPQELASARKEAGLCIRCGVTKYESGSKGHNAAVCRLPVDKTTSVAEGRKKANF
jgi:hypothetical protein